LGVGHGGDDGLFGVLEALRKVAQLAHHPRFPEALMKVQQEENHFALGLVDGLQGAQRVLGRWD